MTCLSLRRAQEVGHTLELRLGEDMVVYNMKLYEERQAPREQVENYVTDRSTGSTNTSSNMETLPFWSVVRGFRP